MAKNNRVYKTGEYVLRYPQKYKGTKTPKFKSSFEERAFFWCDTNENVLEWSYEAYPIQYTFLDHFAKIQNLLLYDLFCIGKVYTLSYIYY